jgi:hypothetical protein
MIALPDGLVLTTPAGLDSARAAAAPLGPGHPGLYTVAVTVSGGLFVVTDSRAGDRALSGTAFAGALSGLALYRADLRLWASWPADPAQRRTLAGNLLALAEVTGATVWMPPEGGAVRVAGDDLVAVTEDGRAGRWTSFGPAGDDSPPRFVSTPDGRLLPALDAILGSGRGGLVRRPGDD